MRKAAKCWWGTLESNQAWVAPAELQSKAVCPVFPELSMNAGGYQPDTAVIGALTRLRRRT